MFTGIQEGFLFLGGGGSCGRSRLGWVWSAGGKARSFEVAGHFLKKIGHHGGYGGVVLGSEHTGLAIKLGRDSDGDVPDFSHDSGLFTREIIRLRLDYRGRPRKKISTDAVVGEGRHAAANSADSMCRGTVLSAICAA